MKIVAISGEGKGHLAPFKLLSGVPEGTCLECAAAHKPELPHNKDSLYYQYKFYNAHGRWPTWKDAMDHCSEDVKTTWIDALKLAGLGIEN